MPDETLLLPTKLHPPARQAGSLLRTRLVDALMERSGHKLQLLIAPAGYGKTTLLMDFAKDLPFPLAWLTLDPADRDPHSFIEYLVAALRTQFPACGASTLRALARTPDIAARSAALARTLAADVYANVPALCLLVLDDFQEVNDSAVVTGFLDELLRLLPENLRVLISSRTYPNLSVFSRLAVEQQLTGLGEADLRFTGEEVRALFQSRYEKDLTGKQAEELADRSEGWIAGLLLSAHGVWDGLLERAIDTRGERGPVYDYLADAAYTRQPAGLRAFLLASSVTRTVDVAICEALLGPGRWLDSLEEAERANLFLSRLPGSPPSFRYHQLFREFLQSRLHREQPEEYRRLHLAAAELMAARSDWPLALEHYQEAGAHAEAAELIGRIAPQLEREGRWYLLARSIDALPHEVRANRPEILIRRARAAVQTGDMNGGAAAARAALDVVALPEQLPQRAEAYQLLGRALRSLGRTDEALDALQTALRLHSTSADLRANVAADLGFCFVVQGNFSAAIEHLTAALSWFEQSGAVHQAARVEVGLGAAYGRLGRSHDAVVLYQRALDRWRGAGEDADDAPLVLNNLGYLLYLQGRTDEAQSLLEQGLQQARASENRFAESMLESSIGSLLLTGGDGDEAEASFRRSLSLAEDLGNLRAVANACEGLGLCAARMGASAPAETWLDRAGQLAERQRSPYLSALVQTDRAQVELSQRRPANALTLLHEAEAELRQRDMRRDLVRVEAVKAIALELAGDHSGARNAFHAALREAARLELPGLLDLPACFERATFESLDPQGYALLRDSVLQRIKVPRRVSVAQTVAPSAPPLPELQVRSFGRGEAYLPGGDAVDWGREKARELFFYLLFDGAVRASRITADLWPETSAARARAGFDSAVYALRRRVHPDAVLIRQHQYMLSPNLIIGHDASEFEALLGRADRESDVDTQFSLWEMAAELYTAPLLEETGGLWAESLRIRFEGRALRTFADLARGHADRGNWRASRAAAEHGLALQPREDLYAAAVRACVQMQDSTGAKRLLRDWRRSELETEGSAGVLFQSLAREIARLAHSPA